MKIALPTKLLRYYFCFNIRLLTLMCMSSFVVTVDGMEGSHEFLLIDDFSGRHGQWVKTNSFTTIDDGKLFAPGNLRGTQVSHDLFCVTVTVHVRQS